MRVDARTQRAPDVLGSTEPGSEGSDRTACGGSGLGGGQDVAPLTTVGPARSRWSLDGHAGPPYTKPV